MGCGTIQSTPNSTVRFSKGFIYVKDVTQTNKITHPKAQENFQKKYLQKKIFKKKQKEQNLKVKNLLKNIKSKQISLNDLKINGTLKKVRFRESWEIQNLDQFQNRQNLLSNNIYQNQSLINQDKKVKKTLYKCNKPRKIQTDQQNSPSCVISKSLIPSIYKSRIVMTQSAKIDVQGHTMSSGLNIPNISLHKQCQNVKTDHLRRQVYKDQNIVNSLDHNRILKQKTLIQKLSFKEGSASIYSPFIQKGIRKQQKQKEFNKTTQNQKILMNERDSYNPFISNANRSIESSFCLPLLDVKTNQKKLQKSKTGIMRVSQCRY